MYYIIRSAYKLVGFSFVHMCAMDISQILFYTTVRKEISQG